MVRRRMSLSGFGRFSGIAPFDPPAREAQPRGGAQETAPRKDFPAIT